MGRYVLGDLLGRGGMAEVFAGHSCGDHGFQKPVAIKRLLPELASDDVFVDRLIDEAKLLVGMQHGNIVSVIDLARDGNDVFLVMEFVDGPSLRQLLKAAPHGSRGLPIGIATYIVQAAAAGLAFAHQRPGGAIIHADISPSNLLLTTSGEVRVADFGIARREGGLDGVVEGKWAYMAPEQARGEALTPAADVFALGVVLYELVCGSHPLGLRITANERESRPLHVIPPRVVNPAITPGLEAICMRALATDPNERYASMQQVIDAIVEERFANHWREGASELAALIRGVAPVAPQAMATADRPLTIATRSLLLRELPSNSVPSLHSMSTFTPTVYGSQSIPGNRFALGTQHNPHRVVEAPVVAPRKLAYVILGIGAVVGAIAAIAIQLAPSAMPASLAAPVSEPVRAPAVVATADDAPRAPTISTAQPPPTADDTAIEMTDAPAPPTTIDKAATKRVASRAATPARKKLDGKLKLGAYPWAWAYVNNKKIEAPETITLPEGKYTVKFQNPENGKHVFRTVVVEGGKTATARVNWEDEE